MSYITHKKSRRVAFRARTVLAEHKEESQAIARFEEPVNETASAVIEHHDRLVALGEARRKVREERAEAARGLLELARRWGSFASLAIPGFKPKFPTSAELVDDVIAAAVGFLGTVTMHEQGAGPLKYSDILHAEIESALEAANLATAAAGGLEGEITETRTQLREACRSFNTVMVAFRRALAATIGTTHPDYRKLRTAPHGTPEDDEVVVEGDEETDAPMPVIEGAAE